MAITSATVKCRQKSLSTVKKLKRHQQEMDERPTYGTDMGQLCCKQAWVASMCYARRTYCLLVQFGGSLCVCVTVVLFSGKLYMPCYLFLMCFRCSILLLIMICLDMVSINCGF